MHACTAQAAPVRDLVCGREERLRRRYTARGGGVRARRMCVRGAGCVTAPACEGRAYPKER